MVVQYSIIVFFDLTLFFCLFFILGDIYVKMPPKQRRRVLKGTLGGVVLFCVLWHE